MNGVAFFGRDAEAEKLEGKTRDIRFDARFQDEVVLGEIESGETQEVFLAAAGDGGEFLLEVEVLVFGYYVVQ